MWRIRYFDYHGQRVLSLAGILVIGIDNLRPTPERKNGFYRAFNAVYDRCERAYAAVVRRVVRRPLIWGGVAAVAMLALAAPALGMRLAYPEVFG